MVRHSLRGHRGSRLFVLLCRLCRLRPAADHASRRGRRVLRRRRIDGFGQDDAAALFESCAAIGAESANASGEEVEAARLFGKHLGIVFQIRDDIFIFARVRT